MQGIRYHVMLAGRCSNREGKMHLQAPFSWCDQSGWDLWRLQTEWSQTLEFVLPLKPDSGFYVVFWKVVLIIVLMVILVHCPYSPHIQYFLLLLCALHNLLSHSLSTPRVLHVCPEACPWCSVSFWLLCTFFRDISGFQWMLQRSFVQHTDFVRTNCRPGSSSLVQTSKPARWTVVNPEVVRITCSFEGILEILQRSFVKKRL